MTPRPVLRIRLLGCAQDPDARLVHLDDGIDALAGAEQDPIDLLRNRDRIAIQRDHLKLWPGSAMRRFSIALALSRCISTRWPC